MKTFSWYTMCITILRFVKVCKLAGMDNTLWIKKQCHIKKTVMKYYNSVSFYWTFAKNTFNKATERKKVQQLILTTKDIDVQTFDQLATCYYMLVFIVYMPSLIDLNLIIHDRPSIAYYKIYHNTILYNNTAHPNCAWTYLYFDLPMYPHLLLKTLSFLLQLFQLCLQLPNLSDVTGRLQIQTYISC